MKNKYLQLIVLIFLLISMFFLIILGLNYNKKSIIKPINLITNSTNKSTEHSTFSINEPYTVLDKMYTGNISVSNNVFLLSGILNGDLVIKKSGKVYVTGIVNGNIILYNGELVLSGILNGKIKGEGKKNLLPSSTIN